MSFLLKFIKNNNELNFKDIYITMSKNMCELVAKSSIFSLSLQKFFSKELFNEYKYRKHQYRHFRVFKEQC